MTEALIVTAGGMGDVAPYTGLGVGLREAGFDVAIATHEAFAGAVTGAGLGFRPLPENPLRLGLPDDDTAGDAKPGFAAGMKATEERIWETAEAILAAARAGADLLLLNAATAPLGIHRGRGPGPAQHGRRTWPRPARPGSSRPSTSPATSGRWATGPRGGWSTGWPTPSSSPSPPAACGPSWAWRPSRRGPCASGRPARPGRSPAVSAPRSCPSRPTGGRASRSSATGGPPPRRGGSPLPSWSTSWPPARRPSTSASAPSGPAPTATGWPCSCRTRCGPPGRGASCRGRGARGSPATTSWPSARRPTTGCSPAWRPSCTRRAPGWSPRC